MHERRVRLDLPRRALSLIHKPSSDPLPIGPFLAASCVNLNTLSACRQLAATRSVSYLHDLGKPLLLRPTGSRAEERYRLLYGVAVIQLLIHDLQPDTITVLRAAWHASGPCWSNCPDGSAQATALVRIIISTGDQAR